jgi:hypothetical protein
VKTNIIKKFFVYLSVASLSALLIGCGNLADNATAFPATGIIRTSGSIQTTNSPDQSSQTSSDEGESNNTDDSSASPSIEGSSDDGANQDRAGTDIGNPVNDNACSGSNCTTDKEADFDTDPDSDLDPDSD